MASASPSAFPSPEVTGGADHEARGHEAREQVLLWGSGSCIDDELAQQHVVNE